MWCGIRVESSHRPGEELPQRDMGWSALSSEPVDVQMISGAHDTILQEPHVRDLAEKLAVYLS